ncbi:MAG: 4-vinyl reductase [Candidatus Woesearchaeota archaeon]
MVSSFLKRLMFARQFEMDEGKITILGEELVMIPGDLLIELQEIDQKRAYEFTKHQTARLISKYFEKIGGGYVRSDAIVCDIFNNFGLGKLSIIESTENSTVVKVTESTIAKDYLEKNKGFSDGPVCYVTAGVLAGMFSFLKKKDINASERECHAKRDDACKFVIE